MAYPVSDRYNEIIYSGDYSHELKLYFNGVELENADYYCESLTIKRRIIPEGGSTFSLNNFISQSIELVLHDVEESVIQTPIDISIGTLVDDEYEYVPIGVFNIEDKPINDKNKWTITARDNSIKFDFNYNAKPLIDENEGSATKLQIFNDICQQANVETDITEFKGSGDLIGIYDNTITARTYITNIAEQAGRIPTIDREGKLIFINITDLTIIDIPIEIVESYESGVHYKVGTIIYESGVIRYETDESDFDTLFIDANNDYINENTLNLIKDDLIGFEIDSFKTGKILGNPAIDGYDLIRINDNDKTFVTLATHNLVYKGNMIQPFETILNENEVNTNVSLNSEATFRKWAKTTIDSVNATVEITTGKVDSLSEETNNNYQEIVNKFQEVNDKIVNIDTLEQSVTQLQTDTYTKTEIQQIASGVGVDGVVVEAVITTSGTFDENGMTYEKTNAPSKTIINQFGVETKNKNDESILFAGYVDESNPTYGNTYAGQTVVASENMIVKNYLVIGSRSRAEDYETGTGMFFIG